MKKKITIVGISIIGLVSILPFIKKDKLIKENIPNNYNTELAVNISEDGTNYNLVNEVPTSGYVLNDEKSICKTQTDTSGIENAPKDNNITIEYKEGKINFLGITKQRTRCYLYFDKKELIGSEALLENITINTGTPDFGQIADSDEGVYKVSDGMYGGDSYYWRGAVTNNYVKFGGFCWRIVRINGDGSIRLIYDGATCHANGTNTTESIAVSNSSYNPKTKSSFVGWTYTEGEQRPSDNNLATASIAKTNLENWYTSNLNSYDSYIINGKFCNDRNPSGGYWRDTGASFDYVAYRRVYTQLAPTLACDSGDIYNLKVGLITADEVMYAGGKAGGTTNTSYYLYNGKNYWTMSPSGWSTSSNATVLFLGATGFLNVSPLVDSYNPKGLRPVINLRSNVAFSSGDGTQSNPFIVK